MTITGEVRKKVVVTFGVGAALLLWSGISTAVPTLQVGAPAGSGDGGIFADYAGTLSNPSEDDTATTSGNTLYLAAAYSAGNQQLLIGGQYSGSEGTGQDWSSFGFDTIFNGAGAILMATVPDGTLGSATLRVNGNAPVFSTESYEVGFDVPNPPSNHAPVQDQAYMFFDLGDFSAILDGTDVLRLGGAGIPDFPPETTSNQPGEIKSATLTNQADYQWIHFDLFALVTDTQGGGSNTRLVTTISGNQGSHDVTWKPGNGGPPQQIPEPGVIILLGMGFVGASAAGYRRRRRIIIQR